MAEVKFDTNLEEVNINGKVTVWLNLSDFEFAMKVAEAIGQMGEIQEKCSNAVNEQTDAAKMFAILREADGKIREKIDALFGMDVCTPLYGNMNAMSYAVFCLKKKNLMFALYDEMLAHMSEQQKKSAPRIEIGRAHV